jgi:hypothetical protein
MTNTQDQDSKAAEKLQLEIDKLTLENKKLEFDREKVQIETETLRKPWYKTTQGLTLTVAVLGLATSAVSLGVSAVFSKVQYDKAEVEAKRSLLAKDEAERDRKLAVDQLAAAVEGKKKADADSIAAEQRKKGAQAKEEEANRNVAALNKQVAKLTELVVETTRKLPAARFVTPMGSKREVTPEEHAKGLGPRDYKMWVEIAPEKKGKIARVTYFLNNPTFPQQLMVGKGDDFRAGYYGSSCLTTIMITVTDIDGNNSQIDFNLCDKVGDDRRR